MLREIKIVKEYNCYQYRARTKFAWLPKQLDDGHKVFFKCYITIEKLCYPRQGLPLHIEVPDQPFWVEVCSRVLPDLLIGTRNMLGVKLEEYIEKLKIKNKEV